MDYKHQIDNADYSKLINKVYLLEAVVFSLASYPFARNLSDSQVEDTGWLCFDIAREVSEMVRGMEWVPDPKPASGCNGSTTGEGSGENS